MVWLSKKFYWAACKVMLEKMKMQNTGQIPINPVEVHLRAIKRSVMDSDVDFDVKVIDFLYWVYSSARDIHRAICPDMQFEPLEAPKSIMEGLDMFGDDITSVFWKVTNAIEDIKTFDMKAQTLLFNSCKEFHKDLTRLENHIKAKHFRNYPIKNLSTYNKIVQGIVLARSVPGLGFEYGYWASDYPILSTSLLNTEKPEWYQKSCGQYRDILLAYYTTEYENILCMYESDGYTCIKRGLPLSADVIAYYLLINDHLEEDTFIPMYDPSFGVPYEKLSSNSYCEIVLNSKIHPNAVILAVENAQQKFKDDYKGARTFCTYYRLPAYALLDGELVLLSEL